MRRGFGFHDRHSPFRFDPATLFIGGAIEGAFYDPSNISTLFQDDAGTTPVTAVEQTVGRILDLSGNGNHATQSVLASRPTYRARYNLLTRTEELQNAAWVTFGTAAITQDATTAPDGALTADKFIAVGAVSSEHLIEQSVTPVAGVYTISIYAKASEYSFVILKPVHVGNSGDTSQVAFNMSTQTWNADFQNRITSYGFQSVGNGWFRVFATFSITSACTSLRARYSVSATSSPTYLADGTSGAFLWGAQLLPANDVTTTGNAYQRVAAATSYDTSSPVWRPYLAFDGSNDSMLTGSIDFTGTDKMTVWAGVTKSSDAATAVLLELSATKNSNNGVFAIIAPAVTANNDIIWYSKGTTEREALKNSEVAPVTRVITGIGNISAPVSTLRLNGVQVNSNVGSQGTGNYGNFPLYIGRRNDASLPFNGRLYGLIVLGAAASDWQIQVTEQWMAGKTGLQF